MPHPYTKKQHPSPRNKGYKNTLSHFKPSDSKARFCVSHIFLHSFKASACRFASCGLKHGKSDPKFLRFVETQHFPAWMRSCRSWSITRRTSCRQTAQPLRKTPRIQVWPSHSSCNCRPANKTCQCSSARES